MSQKKLITIISLMTLNTVYAGDMGPIVVQPVNTLKKVISITAGLDFVHTAYDQTLTVQPPLQNAYKANTSWNTVGDFGGFIGIEKFFSDRLQIQTGVAGYGDTTIHPNGHVWQFALPTFDNFTYNYGISHGRVMFSNKIITKWDRFEKILPFISWEIGAAFNRTQDYQESLIEPMAVPMLPFKAKSSSSFSWAVGIGGDYLISPDLRFGLGYQFADLGSASLGISPSQTSNQTPNIPHLWTNQLRLQLTYLI